jgi:FlaA1/EpsC-like NDP-sugar epimerase
MQFIDRVIEPAVALPRAAKRAIVLALDAALCILAVWIAYYLRLNIWVPLSDVGWQAALASLLALPIFAISGMYRTVFRYVGWDALTGIAQAIFIYGIIYASIFTAFSIDGVPRTVGIIQPVLLLIFVASARIFGRHLLTGGFSRRRLRNRAKKNVLIYGAGSAGRQLAGAFSESYEAKLVGFIDDDKNLHGSVITGVRVWSSERLEAVVEQLGVAEVYLAIPSASRQRRNQILRSIRAMSVAVRTLPGLMDLADGKVTVNDLRPLEIEDLLGRDAVPPDESLLQKNILGKVVLVTGAGGSIGSELCRQIYSIGPATLLLVDASEFALYTIHRELERLRPEGSEKLPELVPLLASVCDENRMRRIFEAWRPHTVYHAAAYKHVPLVEHNVVEGVRNNIIGTRVCARLACSVGATGFVLISTDKAVRPTNMMGASKRLAELVLQSIAATGSKTRFSMVRFGNVLGSSGSVVPLFRQQIAAGGPITVTHREITRFFMTIPEAAQLVLQAGAMARGGEVFVLEMGEPVQVVRLARRMIELSGLQVKDDRNPDGDIEIAFTGLRPGEKLYEELLIGNNPVATDHPRVMMATEPFIPLDELDAALVQLEAAIAAHDVVAVRDLVSRLVPEYSMAPELVDFVTEQEERFATVTHLSADRVRIVS